MNMRWIKYALEVAHCGSINRAAENLYISQPALSRDIRGLEKEVGITIFSRTSSGVQVTHHGSEFLARAQTLYEDYIFLQNTYCANSQPNVFSLSVASVRFAVTSKAFTNVYNRHSRCEYQNACFAEENVPLVMEHIYDGLYSLGVIMVASDQRDYWRTKAEQYRLKWTVLNSEPTCVQVGEHHPLAHCKSIQIQELADYPHATMAHSDVSTIFACSSVRNYDRNIVKKRIVVNDRSMMYEVLCNTNAYYIGINLKNLSLYSGKINYIPLRDTDITIECVVLSLAQHSMTLFEQEYVEELKLQLGVSS